MHGRGRGGRQVEFLPIQVTSVHPRSSQVGSHKGGRHKRKRTRKEGWEGDRIFVPVLATGGVIGDVV